MAYTYDRSPGGDRLTITGCDEHGGILAIAQVANGSFCIPVCIPPGDLEEVIAEMRGWSRPAPVPQLLPEGTTLEDLRAISPEDAAMVERCAQAQMHFYEGPGVILPSGRHCPGLLMRALVTEAGYDADTADAEGLSHDRA